MKLLEKNGALSKTAIMLWIAYIIIIAKYALSGMTIGAWAFPAFDPTAAGVVWAFASGTYVAANSKLTK